MSTADTIYDEVIKNGYAKLIDVANPSNVSGVFVTIPTEFDTFYFSFDGVYGADLNASLRMVTSRTGGASWLNDYYWSYMIMHPFLAPIEYYVSHLDAGADNQIIPISRNNQQGHGLYGYAKMVVGSPAHIENYMWNTNSWGTNPFCNYGSCFPTSAGRSNMVLFQYNIGNIASGYIRTYAMRKGN